MNRRLITKWPMGKILPHAVLGQARWQENHSIMALF
jgi:hypothetical protein